MRTRTVSKASPKSRSASAGDFAFLWQSTRSSHRSQWPRMPSHSRYASIVNAPSGPQIPLARSSSSEFTPASRAARI